ncbi:MAG: DUF3553 domain-containing protein [Pseudomonadota bacterium]
MHMTNPFLEVGALVRHTQREEWGTGQIQSMIGDRITVNFENEGKVVLVGASEQLQLIEADVL